MPGYVAKAAIALGLCTASGSAMAQSLAWQVTEVSGSVTIRHGSDQHPATRGAVLQPGDALLTAAGGRAVMVHEKDFVTLAGNSRATVPGAAEQASGFTKLLQDLGNAVYKIEKRGVPHFGVTTPYLAAVVKGTTFSITVDGRGSNLQVVEGAVEVTTPDGGARDLILPGGVASVAAGDRFRLTVHGDSERVIDSPARAGASAVVAPAAQAVVETAAATPTAALPVGDVAAAGPVNDVIGVTVASHPVDLGALSGGLVSGTAGFTALTATVAQTARANPAVIAAV
ncbi:FecR domain-containing protein, partial [Sphingomonas bacterium]|uniref:FecR domain-containing protein n=1 Tax=Sphingomonas bacterium TaxID=1895847 RepID=UPI001575C407